jgi:hypothetical protein
MFGLCKYKNMFGRPGHGIHRFQIAHIAIADVILTFILAYILQIAFFEKYNYWSILLYCFFSAIIIHRMFCVKTTVDKFLFS